MDGRSLWEIIDTYPCSSREAIAEIRRDWMSTLSPRTDSRTFVVWLSSNLRSINSFSRSIHGEIRVSIRNGHVSEHQGLTVNLDVLVRCGKFSLEMRHFLLLGFQLCSKQLEFLDCRFKWNLVLRFLRSIIVSGENQYFNPPTECRQDHWKRDQYALWY